MLTKEKKELRQDTVAQLTYRAKAIFRVSITQYHDSFEAADDE